jgi:hypothetical protein
VSGRRRAILVGNAAYPADDNLPDLACPLNDVDGLAAVLADPGLGGFEPVATLRDATSAEARRRLVAFLKDAGPEDTVLFYYSGHGKLDRSFALHLCTSDSEVDLLEATGISMRFVHDLLKKCRAQKSVVMLDCCYSGAAAGMKARGNVDEQLKFAVQGTGTYLLTASNGIETAQEKEGGRYGIFTRHVIEGLRSGEADHDGRGYVTMDDLYDYVVRAVRAEGPQRPNREVDGHGDIVIARSGKDSRKDRAKGASQLLFARAAAGDIDPAIAAAAEAVARKRPSEHSAQDAAIDAALDDLLAERITLGSFVTAYWKAQAAADRPSSPPPPPNPDPVRREGKPGPPPENPWRKPAGAIGGGEPRLAGAVPPKARRGLARALWFRFLTPLAVVAAMIAGMASVAGGPAESAGIALVATLAVCLNVAVFRRRLGVVGYVFNGLAFVGCGFMLGGFTLETVGLL